MLNTNESRFHPSDSCINQLLAITHKIFEAFDCISSLKMSSVFLDIQKHLKRFDMNAYFISLRVWAS